jgi:hypothetical protein
LRIVRSLGNPVEAAALVIAFAVASYVIAGPLVGVSYPLLQDLPFHAANASIIHNYFDAGFHFREQFTVQPFAVPYVTMYFIAAALMFFTSALTAIKLAAAVMLALLPAGLAALFHGMGKSPLLGLVGLGFVWCGLTHWGFLNFMGALGLFAMVLGLSLKLVDKPQRRTAVALAAALLLLFFTHPFRFPFAIAASVGCGIVARRWRPLVAPLSPPLLVFALWWLTRPASLIGDMAFTFDSERFAQAGGFLYDSLKDTSEHDVAARAVIIGAITAALLLVLFVKQRRQWNVGPHIVVSACALVFLVMFLSLPMQIGEWWYVYPREITASCFIALGLLPDLPKDARLKLMFTVVMSVALVPLGSVMLDNSRRFQTRDFAAITQHIPPAPKLLYLIFDHQGHTSRRAVFIHLPAYVQAERGGWLSFHFAGWGAAPIVYRTDAEAVVPPAVPRRWEWTPHKFRVLEHGPFFNWFLVRSKKDPSAKFAADTSIVPVAQDGSWWLYRRR